MRQSKWTVILSSLIVLLLVTSSLSCTKTAPPEEPAPEEDEDKAHAEIKASIAGWLPVHTDKVSEEIGVLVTADTPIAREIAAKVVKTALLTTVELSVKHVENLEGEDKYSTKVGLGFPILLELPIIGEKEYWTSIIYVFIIENGEVKDAKIDVSSFDMRGISD